MNQQDSTFNIDTALIGKYLAGEASPEEAIEVENWISHSASNKLLFDQYLTTWSALQTGDSYKIPDRMGVWNNIHQAIKNKPKNNGVKKMFARYPVAAIIAGVAFLSVIPLIFVTRAGRKDVIKNQFITTSAGITHNSLPDGSSVVLNSKSTLKFPLKFENAQREAELEGEAYFSIVPDAARPFSVRFGPVTIQVLGTSFNVRKNPFRNVIETQVNSGKVRMFNLTGEVIISAGQTGIYDEQKNSFELEQVLDRNSFSYATRNFVFADEELGNIIKYLEKAYSKKIELKSAQLAKCKMTSSFNNKSIEYILDVIATTLGITYTTDGITIFIEGGDHGGC